MNARTAGAAFKPAVGFLIGLLVAALCVPYVRTQATTVDAVGSASSEAGAATGSAASPGAGGGSASGASGLGGAGATGGSSSGGGAVAAGGPADTSGSGSVSPTASDIGITETEIRIGFGVLDPGAAAQFGASFDTGNQEERLQALVDAQNAAGGIAGRQIVPFFRNLDIVADPVTSAQAACVGWVEDDQVFAVVVSAQFQTAAVVCVTGAGTPLFTTEGTSAPYYGNGLLFTTQASDDRLLVDHARYLAESGQLEGRTIGVLSGDGPDIEAVNRSLIPTLEQYGYSVARVETVAFGASATQRLPIIVSNFRAAGVDLVITAAFSLIVAPFAQTAEQSNYRPVIAASDFNNQINPALTDTFPNSFDGSRALSALRFPDYSAGLPLSPIDVACFDRVRAADSRVESPDNLAFHIASYECAAWDAFVAAATRAGANPTRASLVAGGEQVGAFDVAGGLTGQFGPGRHDAQDANREIIWRVSCKCWQPADGAATPTRPIE